MIGNNKCAYALVANQNCFVLIKTSRKKKRFCFRLRSVSDKFNFKSIGDNF